MYKLYVDFHIYSGFKLVSCSTQDDGELYDEFGNLKKKFRAKTQQAEAGQVLPGAGRAGWEVEELGISPVPLSLLLLGDQILLLKE